MEMGPPKSELDNSNSLLQMHGSKSESNLFRSFTNGLNGASSSSMQSSLNTGQDQEVVLTSTFSTSDNNFQTPVRGATLFPKHSSRSRFQRSSSHIGSGGTPSSGPRSNPFDSQMSMDRLHLPTFSPSVFSIVVSPSQESTSSGSGGQFWSLDQQARLFPAQISDDSPWKQEAAVSKMDPEEEDKTQEAIDLYFSRHHKITSPEDSVPISVSSLHQRSILMESVGNSPNLIASDKSNLHDNMEQEKINNSSRCSSDLDSNVQSCVSTQTSLSFPPILPLEVEKVLAKYGLKDQENGENERVIQASASGWHSRRNNSRGEDSGQNLSNSTLRRKLFAGNIQGNDEMISDDDLDLDYNNHVKVLDDNDKENCESTAMLISPGKVCFTPNSQRLPSPNKSVSLISFFLKKYEKCQVFLYSYHGPLVQSQERKEGPDLSERPHLQDDLEKKMNSFLLC